MLKKKNINKISLTELDHLDLIVEECDHPGGW